MSRPVRTALRRFLPDGIAGRFALTVIAALLLTQAVSALIYLTDRGDRAHHNPGALVDRIAATALLVEAKPAEQRAAVLRAVDDPLFRVSWSPTRPDIPSDADFGGAGLRRHLREALGDPSRPVLILLERGPPPPGGLFGPGPGPILGTLRVAVGLADGSWLDVTARGEAGPFRLLRFVAWMGLIGLGIAMLSLWAARRMTASLAGFAEAADRLGRDGEAPVLPEAGPRELRQAVKAFNRMQARLSRFIDDRTRMLAAISHDLRTPLTRLRLRAELVEDPEQQARMLADLDEMETMIAATLAFARDDARNEPLATDDLPALVQSLCDDLADAGHATCYSGPAHRPLSCRPLALRRALGNLLDNAVKYGNAARVTLTERPGELDLAIDDDGPGIPESQQEKVFAPFYRLESSRSRDTGGTGLGLAVARTVARAHGGDVVLENRPEGGLRATLVLPG
jgi:signal transduction histidine kinase